MLMSPVERAEIPADASNLTIVPVTETPASPWMLTLPWVESVVWNVMAPDADATWTPPAPSMLMFFQAEDGIRDSPE
eukprot:COSAG01_NODE_65104_length_274_cov_0.702857_1_plen_77_part_00